MWPGSQNRRRNENLGVDVTDKGNLGAEWMKGFGSAAQSAVNCLSSMQNGIHRAFVQQERSATKAVEDVRRSLCSTFQKCSSEWKPPPLRSVAFAALSTQKKNLKKDTKQLIKTPEHIKKLRHVRVFMLMRDDETPLIHSGKFSGKNTRRCGLAFFSFEDAEQLLKKLQTRNSKSLREAYVRGLPLSIFFERFVRGRRTDLKDVTYHFVPESENIVAAQNINASDESISGCPVFVCDSIQDCDASTPYFLSYSDLQHAMEVSLQTAIAKGTAALEQRAESFQKHAQNLRKEAKKRGVENALELEERANAAQKASEIALESIERLPEELEREMVPRVATVEGFLNQFRSEKFSKNNNTLVAPNSITPTSKERKYALEKKKDQILNLEAC